MDKLGTSITNANKVSKPSINIVDVNGVKVDKLGPGIVDVDGMKNPGTSASDIDRADIYGIGIANVDRLNNSGTSITNANGKNKLVISITNIDKADAPVISRTDANIKVDKSDTGIINIHKVDNINTRSKKRPRVISNNGASNCNFK